MRGNSKNSENPYVGTRAFRTGETLYGRRREARELHDLLISERIVLLYSPSRAGKTSLIQARLIPELKAEGFSVFPIIQATSPYHYLLSDQPQSSNRYILSALLHLESDLPAKFQLPLQKLAQLTLADYLKKRLAEEQNAVLIFDQCEEILMQDPTDTDVKRDFFKQVGEVLRNRCRWALFAIDERYRGNLQPYQSLIPTRLKTSFRLNLLEKHAAIEAVKRPALQHGVEIDSDTAEKLIDELCRLQIFRSSGVKTSVIGTPIEPGWLQFVCLDLWKQPRVNPKKICNAELSIINIERREDKEHDRRNKGRRKCD